MSISNRETEYSEHLDMTALSLVYPVQNLINAVMIGFGIGINAVISFYLGAQNKKMADRAATQGMLLGTIHGIGFMILGIAIMRPFLRMFTSNAQIIEYGVRYSKIVFLFATALSWQLVFEKTFQAVGRMVASMTCMIQSYWSNRHIRHVEEEKPKPKYGALLVTTGGNWVNMELLIEGVADFAFDHMEAECIGSVFAKETYTHPVKENEKAKEKARYLGKRLNELCNRK